MIINNILSAKMLRNLCGVRLSFFSGVKFNMVSHYLDAEWATDHFGSKSKSLESSGVLQLVAVSWTCGLKYFPKEIRKMGGKEKQRRPISVHSHSYFSSSPHFQSHLNIHLAVNAVEERLGISIHLRPLTLFESVERGGCRGL